MSHRIKESVDMYFFITLPKADEHVPGVYSPAVIAEGEGLSWNVRTVAGDELVRLVDDDFENATLKAWHKGDRKPDKGFYKFASGCLVIDTGSIAVSRFDSALCVAVTEIWGAAEKTLGYVFAFPDGRVLKVSLCDALKFCEQTARQGKAAVQNMQYVGRSGSADAFLRNYPGYLVPIHTLRRAAVNAETARADPAVKYSALAKMDAKRAAEVFTPEHLEVLGRGKSQGVDIRVYANPAFSPVRMHAVRRVLAAHKSPARLLDPKLSDEMARAYSFELESGADIRAYFNTAYDHRQMVQVKLGVISGIDVSEYADPSVSADEMEQRRVRLSADMWSSQPLHG
jgi:hypothetical protein